MRPASLPDNERERVAALARLALVGTAPEAAFDRLVRLASTLLDVPIAIVSLVDVDRSWFKARVGLDLGETSRDASFCAHTILAPRGEGLIVGDAWLDDRFDDNPLVIGNPRIRFYAGFPIRVPSGEAVGTLAVVDRAPRTMTAREQLALADLAAVAEELVATRGEVVRPGRLDGQQSATPGATTSRAELLELMLEHTGDVVVVVDPTGRITAASDSLQRVLGYSPEDLGSEGALGLVHPDDRAMARSVLTSVASGTRGAEPFSLRALTATGSIRNMECVAVSHFDRPSVGGVVVTMRDVSERHLLSQMLSFQATHDRLTELPNHTLLQEHLRPALARARRERALVAVCCIELTGFADLNNDLGHAAGDELLVDVARRIRSSIRSGDSAARLGGDEFAVLLEPVTSAEEALLVARRIVAAVSGPHSLSAGVSNCGANAGVAVFAREDDVSSIMSRAGRALAAARPLGPGHVELASQPTPAGDLADSAS